MRSLVVLAAGMATRYGADKQLEAVGPSGETLMEYAVYDAWRGGCEQVVFVVREALVSAFQQQVLPRWRDRLDVRLVVQRLEPAPTGRLKPWGTAHALLTAAAKLSGDTLVCNADDYYGRAAIQGLYAHLGSGDGSHAVAGYPLDTTLSPHGGVSRAICRTDAAGMLQHVEERTGIARAAAGILDDAGRALDANLMVSMNLWAFRAPFLDGLEAEFRAFARASAGDPGAEFRIPDVVNARITRGGALVRVLPSRDRWFGMTYAADRGAARTALLSLVAAGDYPRNLFQS